jgi:hypothetical protein
MGDGSYEVFLMRDPTRMGRMGTPPAAGASLAAKEGLPSARACVSEGEEGSR